MVRKRVCACVRVCALACACMQTSCRLDRPSFSFTQKHSLGYESKRNPSTPTQGLSTHQTSKQMHGSGLSSVPAPSAPAPKMKKVKGSNINGGKRGDSVATAKVPPAKRKKVSGAGVGFFNPAGLDDLQDLNVSAVSFAVSTAKEQRQKKRPRDSGGVRALAGDSYGGEGRTPMQIRKS